jgi:hypothetical protein
LINHRIIGENIMKIDHGKQKIIAKPIKLHRSQLVLFVFILCFSGLGLITTRQWQENDKSDRFLNVPLVSKVTADYSSRKPVNEIAQVRLGIIENMVLESQPDPKDLSRRLEAVDSILNLPVSDGPVLALSLPYTTVEPVAGQTEIPILDKTKEPELEKTKEPKQEKTKETNPNNPNKPDKPDKPDKSDKPDNPDKSDKHDKPDKSDKPDKPDKHK